MKKGFLFGLGVLIAGGVLAATISTISIDTKTPGDTVTNQEFNSITSGLGEITDTFNGTTSDDTSITIPKGISATNISTPEICLANECKTAWSSSGSGVTALGCPEGQQLQSVTADGVFTCGEDLTAAEGTGDNLGDHIVLQDLLPEMTDATPLMGNPGGSPSVVSTRNIGSAKQWFKNLWVEDLHVGNQSLYMNGVKVLESDPMIEMRFTADDGQKMSISTAGNEAEMTIKSEDALNMLIESTTTSKPLTIKNNSTNGTIEIATETGATSSSQIKIKSSNIHIGEYLKSKTGINLPSTSSPAYTLDVNGDINLTGDLYQNGSIMEMNQWGAATASSGKKTSVTGPYFYTTNNLSIGTDDAPDATVDIPEGTIIAKRICFGDTFSTSSCPSTGCPAPETGFTSGERNSSCISQDAVQGLAELIMYPFWKTTSTGNIYNPTMMNVGIGVTEPTEKLHVGGNVQVDGDINLAGAITHSGLSDEGSLRVAENGITVATGGVRVGNTTLPCSENLKGTLRLWEDSGTVLFQVCMPLSIVGYNWVTLADSGGIASPPEEEGEGGQVGSGL